MIPYQHSLHCALLPKLSLKLLRSPNDRPFVTSFFVILKLVFMQLDYFPYVIIKIKCVSRDMLEIFR